MAAANAGRLLGLVLAARLLPTDEFGAAVKVLVGAQFLAAVGNLGAPTAVARGVATLRAKGQEPAAAVDGLIRGRVIAAMCFAVLSAAWAWRLTSSATLSVIAALVTASSVLATFFEFAVAGFDAQREWLKLVSPAREVFRYVSLWLLYVFPSAAIVLLVEAVPVVAAFGLGALLVRRLRGTSGSAPDAAATRELVGFARQAIPSSVAGLGLDWLPLVTVAVYGSLADNANFQLAWRWMGLIPTILPISGVAMLATLGRLSVADRKQLHANGVVVVAVLPIAAAALFSALGPIAVRAMGGRAYDEASGIAIVLGVLAAMRVIAPAYRQTLLYEREWKAALAGPLISGAIMMAVTAAIYYVSRVGFPLSVALAAGAAGIAEVAYYVGRLGHVGYLMPRIKIALCIAMLLACVLLFSAVR